MQKTSRTGPANERRAVPWSFLAPAALGLGLMGLHFAAAGSEGESAPTPVGVEAARPAVSYEERREARLEARRLDLAPSVSDSNVDRERKALDRTLKVLGSSPVELVDENGPQGIVVGRGTADLRRFLDEGGHYSGPLPEEPAEDGR